MVRHGCNYFIFYFLIIIIYIRLQDSKIKNTESSCSNPAKVPRKVLNSKKYLLQNTMMAKRVLTIIEINNFLIILLQVCVYRPRFISGRTPCIHTFYYYYYLIELLFKCSNIRQPFQPLRTFRTWYVPTCLLTSYLVHPHESSEIYYTLPFSHRTFLNMN